MDMLKTVSVDLSKLSDGVTSDVKNTTFHELVKKMYAINSNKKNLKKRLKMLIKRYVIPVNLL